MRVALTVIDASGAENNPSIFNLVTLNWHIQVAEWHNGGLIGNKNCRFIVYIQEWQTMLGGADFMAASMIFGISQRRAFRKLVGNSRHRLYRMAYSWTHNPHLADDLVQQTMVKALSKQRQLRDPAAAEAWLFRILSNCLKDYHRAKREVLTDDELVIVDSHTPEHDTEEQQLVRKVRQAVQKLPLAQCQVITLVDLEGFTYASVSEILEIPVGTVMSRLCRGRRALREFLTDMRPQTDTGRMTNLKRVK
jgi:RNA polymerase sigma-70 factor (ECF subfamily)